MNCEFCDARAIIALTVQGYQPQKSGRLIEANGAWSCYLVFVCNNHRVPHRLFKKKSCCIHGSKHI